MRKIPIEIVLIILFILFVIVFVFTTEKIGDSFKESRQNMEQFLGETVIIQKDTLIITDYSMIERNYNLSNGATISYEFVENQKHGEVHSQ
jgi:hypothetical protein